MDVKDRFLKYVSFDTASDENCPDCPSSEKEKPLGAYIRDELAAAGLSGARMDEYGYVYAMLPKTEGCTAYTSALSPIWTPVLTPQDPALNRGY